MNDRSPTEQDVSDARRPFGVRKGERLNRGLPTSVQWLIAQNGMTLCVYTSAPNDRKFVAKS